MLSIPAEPDSTGHLVPWASHLRDTDQGWMRVAQQGVQAFIGQAMGAKVPFAVETVFSHWQPRPDGTVASKIELLQQLQASGYFVLLLFVGLASPQLSIARVRTRMAEGGHAVEEGTLRALPPHAGSNRRSVNRRRRHDPDGQQPWSGPGVHGVPRPAWSTRDVRSPG